MSNNNKNNNIDQNFIKDLKIKISDTEGEKDYSHTLSLLNNNKNRQPQKK